MTDKPAISKGKRQKSMVAGIKRERRGPPMPGSRASKYKKKINGTVEWRG